jgi:hypothetical protein
VLLALQAPRPTVQVNELAPLLKPVTPLWRLPTDVMLAEPRVDQVPAPCTGCVAFKLAVVPQTVWSLPAVDCTKLLVINTSEVLVHKPWLTVQRKLLTPKPKLLTLLTADAGLATTALPPFNTLQLPLPIVGTVACSVPLPLQLVLAKPAFADTLLLLT